MKKILLLLTLCSCSSLAAYDLLDREVRLNFPPYISSIGQAIEYLIAPFEYRIILESPAPVESLKIYTQKIPPLANRHIPCSVKKAILRLLGEGCQLILDHEHKLLTFGYTT